MFPRSKTFGTEKRVMKRELLDRFRKPQRKWNNITNKHHFLKWEDPPFLDICQEVHCCCCLTNKIQLNGKSSNSSTRSNWISEVWLNQSWLKSSTGVNKVPLSLLQPAPILVLPLLYLFLLCLPPCSDPKLHKSNSFPVPTHPGV